MNRKRNLLKAGIIIGALLTAAPVLGVLGTLFGMTRAFTALGSSGVSDPQALSEGIGTSLVSTAVGFALCPVGVVIFTLSRFLLSSPVIESATFAAASIAMTRRVSAGIR
jgi:biopolymer transport protein ExbB/TolQ